MGCGILHKDSPFSHAGFLMSNFSCSYRGPLWWQTQRVTTAEKADSTGIIWLHKHSFWNANHAWQGVLNELWKSHPLAWPRCLSIRSDLSVPLTEGSTASDWRDYSNAISRNAIIWPVREHGLHLCICTQYSYGSAKKCIFCCWLQCIIQSYSNHSLTQYDCQQYF